MIEILQQELRKEPSRFCCILTLLVRSKEILKYKIMGDLSEQLQLIAQTYEEKGDIPISTIIIVPHKDDETYETYVPTQYLAWYNPLFINKWDAAQRDDVIFI